MMPIITLLLILALPGISFAVIESGDGFLEDNPSALDEPNKASPCFDVDDVRCHGVVDYEDVLQFNDPICCPGGCGIDCKKSDLYETLLESREINREVDLLSRYYSLPLPVSLLFPVGSFDGGAPFDGENPFLFSGDDDFLEKIRKDKEEIKDTYKKFNKDKKAPEREDFYVFAGKIEDRHGSTSKSKLYKARKRLLKGIGVSDKRDRWRNERGPNIRGRLHRKFFHKPIVSGKKSFLKEDGFDGGLDGDGKGSVTLPDGVIEKSMMSEGEGAAATTTTVTVHSVKDLRSFAAPTKANRSETSGNDADVVIDESTEMLEGYESDDELEMRIDSNGIDLMIPFGAIENDEMDEAEDIFRRLLKENRLSSIRCGDDVEVELGVVDDVSISFAKAFLASEGITSLQKLYINFHDQVSPELIARLLNKIEVITSIEEHEIHGCSQDQERLIVLMERLVNKGIGVSLPLDSQQLSLEELKIVLRLNGPLTNLNLWSRRAGLSLKEVIDVVKALEGNTTVTDLDIDSQRIGLEGTIAFVDVLRGDTGIINLFFSGNAIGSEGAIVLARALRRNTTITTLSVNHNEIGSAGAIAFIDMLRENATIIKLFFSKGNGIGAKEEQLILQLLSINVFLQKHFPGLDKLNPTIPKIIKRRIISILDEMSEGVIKNADEVDERILVGCIEEVAGDLFPIYNAWDVVSGVTPVMRVVVDALGGEVEESASDQALSQRREISILDQELAGQEKEGEEEGEVLIDPAVRDTPAFRQIQQYKQNLQLVEEARQGFLRILDNPGVYTDEDVRCFAEKMYQIYQGLVLGIFRDNRLAEDVRCARNASIPYLVYSYGVKFFANGINGLVAVDELETEGSGDMQYTRKVLLRSIFENASESGVRGGVLIDEELEELLENEAERQRLFRFFVNNIRSDGSWLFKRPDSSLLLKRVAINLFGRGLIKAISDPMAKEIGDLEKSLSLLVGEKESIKECMRELFTHIESLSRGLDSLDDQEIEKRSKLKIEKCEADKVFEESREELKHLLQKIYRLQQDMIGRQRALEAFEQLTHLSDVNDLRGFMGFLSFESNEQEGDDVERVKVRKAAKELKDLMDQMVNPLAYVDAEAEASAADEVREESEDELPPVV